MMTRRELAVAVEVARHAVANVPQPLHLPATVTAVAGGTATVLIDSARSTVPVVDLVGTSVGHRVIVECRPNGAAYIVNTIS